MQNYDSMTRDRTYRDSDDRMSRDRYDREYGHDRNRHEDRNSDRSAFFGSDRDRSRYDSSSRGSWRNDRSRSSDERFGRSRGHDLIASDRVEGTAVYGRDGNKIGTIHNFMVEKRRGQVRYAVMKCSDGFLGMDERYYPLEWSELDYDTDKDGYCVSMTERDLDNRRSFDSRGRPTNERSDNQRSGW